MNAIELDRVTKVYRVYQGSRGILKELLLRRQYHRPFWALKEFSFQAAGGLTLGVIGNNGAGKSTLLKLITGTTAPTSGSVWTRGRVASLLELGTGFHPEFTGHENILFTAATMGVQGKEALARVPEIIEFSELSEFINQPVRTYSSGMYLRLGFAVATAFDPDILVIDEALAVGDQNFQKKCIDRIHRFKEGGRNIVFCSHNLYQVRHLCDQAVWLHRGECRASGPAPDVVDHYSDFQREAGSGDKAGSGDSPAGSQQDFSRIESAALTDLCGRRRDVFQTGEGLRLTVRARFRDASHPNLGIAVVRNDGTVCYCTNTGEDLFQMKKEEDGAHVATLEFSRLELLSGRYHFSIATTDERSLQAYQIVESTCPFIVRHVGSDYGLVRLPHQWK
jgi:lipopolysaccharide transport system ATP-binding protein